MITLICRDCFFQLHWTRNDKKMASDLHRTATTAYLCYVPILEDSAGAGRVGLAAAKIQSFYIFARN